MGLIAKLPPRLRTPVGIAVSKVYTFGRILSWALRPRRHVNASGVEASVVVPALEEAHPADPALLAYGLAIAAKTAGTFIASVDRLNTGQEREAQRWPGYNYRLLKALVADRKPKIVVEIGTFEGLSALSMLEALPEGSKLVTYDVIPWDRFPQTVLRKADFSRGLEQRIGNLSSPAYFASQRDVILGADLFYVDGPKDLRFVPAFMSLLRAECRKPALLVWDDIRLLKMIEEWRTLDLPKADMTSLGHWTGTGFLEVGRPR